MPYGGKEVKPTKRHSTLHSLMDLSVLRGRSHQQHTSQLHHDSSTLHVRRPREPDVGPTLQCNECYPFVDTSSSTIWLSVWPVLWNVLMKLTTSKLVDFHKEPKPAHNGIKKWCEIANYHKTSDVATMCRWLLDSMVSTSGTFHIKSRNENKVNMQWNRPMYTQIGQNAKSYQRHQQPLSKPRDSSPMLPSRDYGNYYNKVHSRRCPTDE